MSTFGIVALVVLAVVAAVLVVVAAVRQGRARRPSPGEAAASKGPTWYEILLAMVLVAALVILAIVSTVEITSGGAAAEGWRAESRSTLFLGVMLAVAALALVFLVAFLLARLPAPGATTPAGESGAAPAGTVRDPAGSRLVGLLLVAVGFLLLGWVYLGPAARADLMVQVLYPAAIAVAIVLLFDKATRSWTPKTRSEGFREWLLCDLILITLVLGFLNLKQLETRDAYGGFLWDMVHIAAFFLVFWCLDRTSMRGRFLVGFGYLTLLPLLLLLWRWVQETEAPADAAEVDMWSTIWPVFFLALVFLVLEIISLLVLRGSRGHVVPAIKDAVFVVLYAIFLIAAAPGGG